MTPDCLVGGDRANTDPARRDAGLTLLEVLAATLIFALVMTVVVGTSSTGVHRASLAARRLEASLLADDVVAALESDLRAGVPLPVERVERVTEDGYTIHVLPRTIDVALADPVASAGDPTAPATPNGPGGTTVGGNAGISALITSAFPPVARHLWEYDVEVSWEVGGGTSSVTRTTFAFDWKSASTDVALAPLFAGQGSSNNQQSNTSTGAGGPGGALDPTNPPSGLPRLDGERGR